MLYPQMEHKKKELQYFGCPIIILGLEMKIWIIHPIKKDKDK